MVLWAREWDERCSDRVVLGNLVVLLLFRCSTVFCLYCQHSISCRISAVVKEKEGAGREATLLLFIFSRCCYRFVLKRRNSCKICFLDAFSAVTV